ncbi:hypothetical protein QBC39DRAFT_354347 [Podospora conica]|nr:hypothetical protein QBC39DRAFT_354347 [Schizothecium conicum]
MTWPGHSASRIYEWMNEALSHPASPLCNHTHPTRHTTRTSTIRHSHHHHQLTAESRWLSIPMFASHVRARQGQTSAEALVSPPETTSSDGAARLSAMSALHPPLGYAATIRRYLHGPGPGEEGLTPSHKELSVLGRVAYWQAREHFDECPRNMCQQPGAVNHSLNESLPSIVSDLWVRRPYKCNTAGFLAFFFVWWGRRQFG